MKYNFDEIPEYLKRSIISAYGVKDLNIDYVEINNFTINVILKPNLEYIKCNLKLNKKRFEI
jgi:hypothetical protein